MDNFMHGRMCIHQPNIKESVAINFKKSLKKHGYSEHFCCKEGSNPDYKRTVWDQ